MFSFGSNGQVGFESEVLERHPHCQVHTYDHTLDDAKRAAVRAVTGVQLHEKAIGSGPQLEEPGADTQRQTSIAVEMSELSIDWIDILKIDIEGSN